MPYVFTAFDIHAYRLRLAEVCNSTDVQRTVVVASALYLSIILKGCICTQIAGTFGDWSFESTAVSGETSGGLGVSNIGQSGVYISH